MKYSDDERIFLFLLCGMMIVFVILKLSGVIY